MKTDENLEKHTVLYFVHHFYKFPLYLPVNSCSQTASSTQAVSPVSLTGNTGKVSSSAYVPTLACVSTKPPSE